MGFGGSTPIDAGRSVRAYRDRWQAIGFASLDCGYLSLVSPTAGASVDHERVLGALGALFESQGWTVLSCFAWDGEPFTLTPWSVSHEVTRDRNKNHERRKVAGIDIAAAMLKRTP